MKDRFEAFFTITMYWRIFYGLFRTLIGFVLLLFASLHTSELFKIITQHEITEDPTDVLVNFLIPIVEYTSVHISYFLAFYFLFWGFIDIFLSINMLRKDVRAFPIGLVVIILFLIYEMYRFFHTHSIILLGIILIDFVIIYLIYKEWRKLKPTTIVSR